ncbi:MAG TPA: sialidase family protein [Longimicrobiaceae bacterium]
MDLRSALRCACLLPALAGCGPGDAPAPAASAPAALGAPGELPSPATPGSAEPNLAAGEDGRVYLSWVEPGPDSTHALRFATLEGERWSAPRTVASGRDWFVNWADFPMLAVLPDGRLAAHWLQRSGKGRYAYDVRIARSSDGGATWTPGVVPHRDGTESEHGFVSLWAEGGDSVGAAWLDGRKYAAAGEGEGGDGEHGGGEMMVMSAVLGPDGAPGPEASLDARACDCCQTGVASTSRGPLLVYRDRSPDEIRDVYVTRRVDGRWTEPRPVHADGWKIPACPVNGPQASARGERVAVAWFTGARDTARVLVAFSSDAGATFGAPVRVDDGAPAGRVDVELLDDGAALVSWIERTGGEAAEVRARRVAAGGARGPAVTVTSTSGERASGFPRMARGRGGVVFAWTEPGKPSRVRTARLAPGGGR